MSPQPYVDVERESHELQVCALCGAERAPLIRFHDSVGSGDTWRCRAGWRCRDGCQPMRDSEPSRADATEEEPWL